MFFKADHSSKLFELFIISTLLILQTTNETCPASAKGCPRRIYLFGSASNASAINLIIPLVPLETCFGFRIHSFRTYW